jgi:hypothetical protein
MLGLVAKSWHQFRDTDLKGSFVFTLTIGEFGVSWGNEACYEVLFIQYSSGKGCFYFTF